MRPARGSWRGGPNPTYQKIVFFFSNPSSNPTIPACTAQIEIPFPFSIVFLFINPSPSAQNPISQPLKKCKSQLPFYPFTTLLQCKRFKDLFERISKELKRRPLVTRKGQSSRLHHFVNESSFWENTFITWDRYQHKHKCISGVSYTSFTNESLLGRITVSIVWSVYTCIRCMPAKV